MTPHPRLPRSLLTALAVVLLASAAPLTISAEPAKAAETHTISASSVGSASIVPGRDAQAPVKVTGPKEALGFAVGDDYQMASYTQLEAWWKKLAAESPRMKLVDIGPTEEGRHQYMAVITSPENQKKLDRYRDIVRRLTLAEGLTEEQAHALAREGKAVVWIDGGLHATETVGSQQIMETVYQMVSRTDPETMRFLNDDILLAVLANPDGQEMVAKWYMREPAPTKRSLAGLPQLYNKYVGHDDNRDFFMSNMKETTNMNRVMFLEWYPQIVYNHHQPGANATGGVIFMPPFRDPFNYNFDPLIPTEIEQVGALMHARLIAQGKPGSGMRSYSNYSTWWNGGLRTITYFHNMVGLLTEIIGNPTPIEIPLIPDRQLPSGDLPMPVPPQTWHYRQSIDYDVENNRAVLDYASRNRETLLYDMYVKGRRAIDRGSADTWTVTPKRIEALKAAAANERGTAGGEGRGTPRATTVPTALYDKVLHDPTLRDPRGYIISADQPDFPTAVKFVNALLKTGVVVQRATAPFQVGGKSYPAESLVVKTAQAFRAHVVDMFEPQDHPNDFRYPGGPPIPPYDITGWTLAMQMGVQYDRVSDGFDGPFAPVSGQVAPPARTIAGGEAAAGYLISHRENDAFVVINRLLKANCDVYWMTGEQKAGDRSLGAGAIWVPASAAAKPIVERGAKELGIDAIAVSAAPRGDSLKLKPIRIGLYDQYGDLMPAGWVRWLFEQYEFPFEIVRPQTLDGGNLNSKFDVLVFTDGAFRHTLRQGRGGANAAAEADNPGGFGAVRAESIPAEYRSWLGRITEDRTVPALKQFVEAGGTVVTIGSSSTMGELLGVPVKDYLTEKTVDGERPLPQEKFYIPGSLLRVTIDTTDPLAFGMPPAVDVVYDNSPVFKLAPDAALKKTRSVGWFAGSTVLDSGWAWGQQYLDGGTAIAESTVGRGRVVLLGPEVTFRGQPHGTFKLLFNGVYLAGASSPAPRTTSDR